MATTFVHYLPAQNVTCKAQADIKAGLFVEVAAGIDGRTPVVKPATAGAAAFGVIAHDVEKDGYAMVYRQGHILDVQATGSINPGDEVACGAGGKAAKASESAKPVGQVLAKSVDGATVTVALY